MSTSIINSNGLTELAKKIKNPASYLDVPTGEILWLSAKGCTTESIAEEGGVIDISGNGNHGRAIVSSGNGVSIVNDTEKGNCYYDNNTSTYISVPLASNLESNFTLAFLMKHLESSNRGHMPIRLYNNDTMVGYIWTHSSSGATSFRLDGTGEKIIGTAQVQNVWKLLTVVRHDGYIELYLDGAFTDKNATTATSILNRIDIYPYRRNYTDIRIYPYALTPTQVKTLYMLQEQPLARVHSRNIIEPTDMTSSEIETMTSEIFTGE